MFKYEIILYIGTPKDSHKRLLEVIREFGEVIGYKANTQKSTSLRNTNDTMARKKLVRRVPFTIAISKLNILE